MGGDGGVVATDRRYMRGAGTADHTGDSSAGTAASAADVKANQQREAREIMSTCAISRAKLRPGDDSSIVACRFGRLYLKEAVVQALLRRKMGEATGAEKEALAHVKKLSELYAVRGNTSISSNDSIVWTCPITAKTLNGSVPPAILLVPGNLESSNVVSEFAHKQLSAQDMESEYGPIERKIRLAPTPEELVKVKEALEQERNEKKNKKDNKKSCSNKVNKGDHSGKRKRIEASAPAEEKKEESALPNKQARASEKHSSSSSGLGSAIRSRVDSALESNQVLSSIFSDKQKGKPASSEKNRKDNLFAR